MKFMWRVASIHVETWGSSLAFGFQTPRNRDVGLVRQGAAGVRFSNLRIALKSKAHSNLVRAFASMAFSIQGGIPRSSCRREPFVEVRGPQGRESSAEPSLQLVSASLRRASSDSSSLFACALSILDHGQQPNAQSNGCGRWAMRGKQ